MRPQGGSGYRRCGLWVVLVCSGWTAGAEAQPPTRGSRPVEIPGAERHTLPSSHLNRELEILVRKPDLRGGPASVVYVLDADLAFPLVHSVVASLQSGQELPNVLVVGVGYPGGQGEGSVLRNLDYTPTEDSEFGALLGALAGRDPMTTGGGPAFLRFVLDELKPWVESRYPVRFDDSTLIGASFGGLFGLYALFEAPGAFQRFVLSSPSVWWDDRATMLYEEAYAARHEDLSARLFIGVGGRENAREDSATRAAMPPAIRERLDDFEAQSVGGVSMIESIEPLVDVLRARRYPSLALTYHVFADETHASVPPASISRGLRVVFETF